MPRYRTNVALSLNGDRIEKKSEIDLTEDQASQIDPADITPLQDVPVAAEPEEVVVPLEEMTLAQLKDSAKELGLSTTGSKADLQERIQLHLDGAPDDGDQPEEDITSE